MRRAIMKRGKAVAEDKRQIEMSPYEIRDWANDIRSDHGKWSATADKLDGIADTIEALQQRVGELECLWRNGDLVVNEALAEDEYQRVLRVLHREPGGIMTPHGLAPQEPELVLKDYPPVKYCSLCGSLVTTCVHMAGNAPKDDQALHQEPGEGGGGELEPHAYVPSAQHMGDCRICGHLEDSPLHKPHPAQPEQAQEGECTCPNPEDVFEDAPGHVQFVSMTCPIHGTGRQEEDK